MQNLVVSGGGEFGFTYAVSFEFFFYVVFLAAEASKNLPFSDLHIRSSF